MKVKTFEIRFCSQRPSELEQLFQTWYDKERENAQYFRVIETNLCQTDYGLTYVVMYDCIPFTR